MNRQTLEALVEHLVRVCLAGICRTHEKTPIRVNQSKVKDYMVQVIESARIMTRGNSDSFNIKMRQLAWNLSNNAWHLITHHGPSLLVCLPDAVLCEGTKQEASMYAEQSQRQECMAILNPNQCFTDSSPALLVCKKCHSKDVVIDQTQTRSADEGMTVKVTCESCGARWKL